MSDVELLNQHKPAKTRRTQFGHNRIVFTAYGVDPSGYQLSAIPGIPVIERRDRRKSEKTG